MLFISYSNNFNRPSHEAGVLRAFFSAYVLFEPGNVSKTFLNCIAEEIMWVEKTGGDQDEAYIYKRYWGKP